MMNIFRMAGLAWADGVVDGAFFLMQNYLTNVWKLSFTRAAQFLNIWNGIYRILPIFFVFLADKILGNFLVILFSGISSTAGLVLMTMAAWNVAISGASTCKLEEEGACINQREKTFFITGMALVALGKAARTASSDPFTKQHAELGRDSPQCLSFISIIVFVCTPIVVIFAFPHAQKWSVLFGISAACTAFASLFYLSGVRHYKKGRAKKAAAEPPAFDFVVRRAVRLVPVLSTYLLCGIVSSAGSTYFIEQVSHMNFHIGKWETPPQLLMLVSTASNFVGGGQGACFLLAMFGKTGGVLSGALGLVSSALCCTVAAAVERRRLHVVRRNNLLDLDDAPVPMRATWMWMQFYFLAWVDTYVLYGLNSYNSSDKDPKSMERYVDCLSEAVTGLGFVCSAITVYVVGHVSETGGRENWFQQGLNRSRLDRYYWVLATLCAINLIVFVVGACVFGWHCKCQDESKYDAKEIREYFGIKKNSDLGIICRYFTR